MDELDDTDLLLLKILGNILKINPALKAGLIKNLPD